MRNEDATEAASGKLVDCHRDPFPLSSVTMAGLPGTAGFCPRHL